MIRSVVQWSMKFRFLVLIVAVALTVVGVSQLRTMPVDVLPEFLPPTIEIQTEALGLSAEEVEALITVPLEANLLNGVAWLESISSKSITGLSSVLLVFEPGTDIMRARQMVQERLTQAHALPKVSKPPTMLQPLSSTSRVAMVGLSSDTLSLIDMSVLARWNIKPKLLGVPGVANVAIWGKRERQLQVLVDPERLDAQDVSLQQVINTSGNALWVSPLTFLNASYPGTGGWIETPNQRLGIRHLLPITTPEDLARVSVEGTEGLSLGDVADIVEDHQPLIGDALVNDDTGLLLVLEKFPGEDTANVARGVQEAIAAMAPGLTGLEFDTRLFQPAAYIEEAQYNVTAAIGISAFLVVLVFFAFLFSWRSGVVGLVTIPLSLLSALVVLRLSGATLNVMVLAGLLLALVAVVDDAVLDTENIKRRLQQARKTNRDTPVAQVILEASLETRRPALFATLILLLVSVPLFVLGGLSGAFFGPLAVSYACAVTAAFVVALTVPPALSLLLFAKTPESTLSEAPRARESPLEKSLQNGVNKTLIERPLPVFIVAGLLLTAGLFALPRLHQTSLLPTFKELDLLVRWVGEPGASRQAMSEAAAQATRELRALPGVSNVAAHIGRAVTSDEVSDVNAGELWVSVAQDADYAATVAAVSEVANRYPDFTKDVTTYLHEVTDAAAPHAADELRVRVFGDDLALLKERAAEVEAVVAGIAGVSESRVQALVEKPNLEVEVDLARAEQYGLKPGDVRRTAATLLSGIQVGSLFEEQKVFDVVVWGVPELRADLESVRGLLIDTPSGDQVPLSDVAEVHVAPTFDTVFRQDVSRYLDVVAVVSGRTAGAVAADIDDVLTTVTFPTEFHAVVLSDYAERGAARRNFLGFALAALVGIFLLQQAAFGSWRSALVAFIGLGVAMTGAVLVAVASGGNVSVGVAAGLLATLALAVRSGMTLISHYRCLQLANGRTLDSDLVVRATREKLPPILGSAVALGVALLPFVVFGTRAGLELLQPMALVMLGGVVTTTVTTLYVLPALYLRFKAAPEPELEFGPAEAWLPPRRTADATD